MNILNTILNVYDNYINITTSQDIDYISSIRNKYAKLVIHVYDCSVTRYSCPEILVLLDSTKGPTRNSPNMKKYEKQDVPNLIIEGPRNYCQILYCLYLYIVWGSSCTETFNFPNFNMKAPTTPNKIEFDHS